MKDIKTLIFDFDGVLFFSERANAIAYNRAFDDLGLKINDIALTAPRGRRVDQLIQDLVPDFPKEDYQKLKDRKFFHYQKLVNENIPNWELINFLRNMSHTKNICLATSASSSNVNFLLQHFDLEKFFDFMVFGHDVKKSKPDPECFVKCMQQMKCAPEQCLIFEDSELGLKAAENSGAPFIKIVPPELI
ncbi:MAG: HAD family hydrolase [Bacteriovoracia bacterium]